MNKGNMFTIEKKDPTFLSYVITFGLVLEVQKWKLFVQKKKHSFRVPHAHVTHSLIQNHTKNSFWNLHSNHQHNNKLYFISNHSASFWNY